MKISKLQKIIVEHHKWLTGKGGRRADLRGAVLRRAVLSDADLSDADLSGADLSDAVLRGAVLRGAVLSDADLRRAVLSDADLRRADLRRADLRGAVLRGAVLSDADLSDADLSDADLPCFQICPEEGEFIGWKKVYGHGLEVIAKIKIIGRRNSCLSGRKCRTDAAEVLEFQTLDGKVIKDRNIFHSGHRASFIYRLNHTVIEPSYNSDITKECTDGIHFFMTKQEAINW